MVPPNGTTRRRAAPDVLADRARPMLVKTGRMITLVAMATICVAGCQQGTGAEKPSTTRPRGVTSAALTRAQVTATVDSDTFRVDLDGKSPRIRILGIIH